MKGRITNAVYLPYLDKRLDTQMELKKINMKAFFIRKGITRFIKINLVMYLSFPLRSPDKYEFRHN